MVNLWCTPPAPEGGGLTVRTKSSRPPRARTHTDRQTQKSIEILLYFEFSVLDYTLHRLLPAYSYVCALWGGRAAWWEIIYLPYWRRNRSAYSRIELIARDNSIRYEPSSAMDPHFLSGQQAARYRLSLWCYLTLQTNDNRRFSESGPWPILSLPYNTSRYADTSAWSCDKRGVGLKKSSRAGQSEQTWPRNTKSWLWQHGSYRPIELPVLNYKHVRE